MKLVFLPWHNDDEVHDVPEVPHVAVLVQDEAQGQDFGAHFDREDDHEDGLQLLLKVNVDTLGIPRLTIDCIGLEFNFLMNHNQPSGFY